MPTIAVFYGIIIQMYWLEHGPPHFHAKYAGYEAVVDIRTLEITQGSLPSRAGSLVLEWARKHQAELLEDWDLCTAKKQPKKIAPLD